MDEIGLLKRQLANIVRALRKNKERFSASSPHSYVRQELEAERAGLIRFQRITENKIHAENAPPPSPDERRKKFLDYMEAERRENTEAFIQKLEREGDHRQARIWRMTLIDLRTRIEQQYT